MQNKVDAKPTSLTSKLSKIYIQMRIEQSPNKSIPKLPAQTGSITLLTNVYYFTTALSDVSVGTCHKALKRDSSSDAPIQGAYYEGSL